MATNREAVAAAFDKLETAAEPVAEVVTDAPALAVSVDEDGTADSTGGGAATVLDRDDGGGSTPPPAAEVRARDATGKFAKGEAKPKAEATKPPAKGEPSVTAAPVVGTPPTVTTPPAVPEQSATKPPQSWKPAEREAWAKAPPEVQAAVLRREKEVTASLSQAVENKTFRDTFKETIAPFAQLMATNRMDPVAVTRDALQFVSAMHTAPAGHKAQLLANMVKTFDIPVEALAAALDGQPQAQGQGQQPQQFDPSQIAAQVRQQVLQELQQSRAQRQTQKAAQDAATFAEAHEFFDDVREDMADLMEIADRRGVALSMEDAYNRACKMHPEVSRVFQQREAAKAATASTAATQRARDAASSVKSQPLAPMNGAQPRTNREAVERAWEQHARGR